LHEDDQSLFSRYLFAKCFAFPSLLLQFSRFQLFSEKVFVTGSISKAFGCSHEAIVAIEQVSGYPELT
jgi:hypothetical protein